MASLQILPQKKGKDTVKIKHLRFFPIENKETLKVEKFGRFKFPILKVVVGRPDAKRQYEITWSNYYKQSGSNPGKFVVRQVERTPRIIYVMDGRRVRVVKGVRQVDYVAMVTKFDTTLKPGLVMQFAPNHPLEKVVHFKAEAEHVAGFVNLLKERKFPEALITQVLGLYLDHEIFQAFLKLPARKAA